LTAALYQCDVPYFSVVLRKVFGVAGAAFVDNRVPNMRVAWPSGDWGSLPLEGGIYVSNNLIFSIYLLILLIRLPIVVSLMPLAKTAMNCTKRSCHNSKLFALLYVPPNSLMFQKSLIHAIQDLCSVNGLE
jgi:hypothetical protein